MSTNYTRLAKGISEAAFQTRITELCAWLRLKWHHETDSRKTRKGWPDLVIAGPHGVVFSELKKNERERPSPEQEEWLNTLHAAGARVYVWRPADWPEINRVLHELAGRACPREFSV